MSLNIPLIQQSFDVAKPIAGDVATKFYKTLFENHPEAKGLFGHVDFAKQEKLLINSLVYIVDHLDQPEALETYLRNMGGRHVAYGTEPEHYPWVGEALLQTFAYFFGEDWTNELQTEWSKAFGIIAEIMLEGAAKVKEADQTDHSNNVVNINGQPANQHSRPETEIKLPENVRLAIREQVEKQFLDAVQAEVDLAIESCLNQLGDQVNRQLEKLSRSA